MSFFKWIIIATLALSALGCVQFTKKQTILCTSSCEIQFNKCVKYCHNNCMRCSRNADILASKNYILYKNEQYVKGGLIVRDLQSFRDPLQCRKITCSCSADYELCRQNCGGYILKRLQSAPVC